MKDITMAAPAADATATTADIVIADKHSDLRLHRLVQAIREQIEAQNRIADQLEELNDKFDSFGEMMYVHMHATSTSLDGIDRSLNDITGNI